MEGRQSVTTHQVARRRVTERVRCSKARVTCAVTCGLCTSFWNFYFCAQRCTQVHITAQRCTFEGAMCSCVRLGFKFQVPSSKFQRSSKSKVPSGIADL